jgi:hypothetical protein
MKKILAALALLALVFGAAFAAEASVTVDYGTAAFVVDKTTNTPAVGPSTSATQIRSFARGGEDEYSPTSIAFSVAEENYGANFTIGITDDTRHYRTTANPTTDGVADTGTGRVIQFFDIDRLSAWVKLGGIVQFEAGKFISRRANRLTSVIDDYKLGVFSFGATPWDRSQAGTYSSVKWVQGAYETDRLQGPLMATIFIPNTDFLIDFAAIDFVSVDYDNDGNNTTGAAGGLTTTGFRFQGSIMEGLKLTFTYRWINEAYTVGSNWYDFPGYINTTGRQYRNNFGLYFNVDMIENLKLLIGYGGSFVYASKDDDTIKANLFLDPGSVKGLNFYSGIDLRAEYALAETVKLATHNNITFGSHGFKDADILGGGGKMTWNKTGFILENAVAVEIGLTETISVTPKIKNILTIAEFEDVNPGTNEKTNYTKDWFSIEAAVGYAPAENVSVSAGLGFEFRGAKKSEFSPAGGTTTTTKEDEVIFWIPVGITVKF